MANNQNLGKAKREKFAEYYTQYPDIEREMQEYISYNKDVFRDKTILLPCDDPDWSNFTRFFVFNFKFLGLKKLISTSYAPDAKKKEYELPIDFSHENPNDPKFDATKWQTHGKIFVLERGISEKEEIDINALQWEYLEGDGDFRSQEVTKLRDEADFIITNPPFPLFHSFWKWLLDSGKQFSVIGNMNAITYKEVFPTLQENKAWIGGTGFQNDMVFRVPKGTYIKESDRKKAEKLGYPGDYTRLGNSCWYTNIDYKRHHEPMKGLMTMEDNRRYSRHKSYIPYRKYDNYDAIDVKYSDMIPSDYYGVMGVSLSFLDKYCPEQFKIIWCGGDIEWATTKCTFFTPPSKENKDKYKKQDKTWRVQNPYFIDDKGNVETVYQRLFIQRI